MKKLPDVLITAILLGFTLVVLVGTVRKKLEVNALDARITELKTQQSENRDFCKNAEAICQQALELCKENE